MPSMRRAGGYDSCPLDTSWSPVTDLSLSCTTFLILRSYDTQSVIALIRAAEASRSPAILQLFPITMAQFGKEFVRFCINAAHASQVPISVHVDHAGSHEDIDRVLTWAEQGVAVDSIMIDCSHHETDEENIQMALPYCKRAAKLGMAVEVELGRLAGGEAGVRVIEEGALTKVEKAEKFLDELGAQMLAPSIGNVHGRQPYLQPPENAQPFRIDLLKQLQDTVGPGTKSDAFLVLHGTDDVPDELFKKCIAAGARKMNVNR